MRILSHQAHRHVQNGLPARTENSVRYRPHTSRKLLKQAGEIQDRLTAELENRVMNEANHPEKFSPLEF